MKIPKNKRLAKATGAGRSASRRVELIPDGTGVRYSIRGIGPIGRMVKPSRRAGAECQDGKAAVSVDEGIKWWQLHGDCQCAMLDLLCHSFRATRGIRYYLLGLVQELKDPNYRLMALFVIRFEEVNEQVYLIGKQVHGEHNI